MHDKSLSKRASGDEYARCQSEKNVTSRECYGGIDSSYSDADLLSFIVFRKRRIRKTILSDDVRVVYHS